MTRQAHLVGSVGLRDVETVLRTVSESLRPGRPRNTHIDLEKKVEVLTRELGKALEQQAAVSEILRVISSSPGNLQTVFETILANATRLCEGQLRRFVAQRRRSLPQRCIPRCAAVGIHGAVAQRHGEPHSPCGTRCSIPKAGSDS